MIALQRIRTIAESQGRSVVQLAQEMGITSMGIYKMMKLNSTRVDTLQRIADALGVDIRVFFGEDIYDPAEIKNLKEEVQKLSAQVKEKDEIIHGLVTALNAPKS